MAKKIPLNPKHPERICWGCDRYCAADALGCGNGSGRTQHPAELLGEDWYTYGDWDIEGPLTAEKKVLVEETPAKSDGVGAATPEVIWLHQH